MNITMKAIDDTISGHGTWPMIDDAILVKVLFSLTAWMAWMASALSAGRVSVKIARPYV
jgi:hypothetical protein